MNKPPFDKKIDSIEVRVAPNMKKSFMESCGREQRSASDVMRLLMEDYVSGAGRASKPRWKEPGMLALVSKRFARVAAVTGAVVAVGIMPTASTAADARLEALFHWFDADGDGALTSGEFLGHGNGPPPSLAGAEVMLTTKDGHRPGETAADVFGRVDGDRDGRITLSELTDKVAVQSRVGATLLGADQDASNSVTAAELAARITEARAAAGASRPAAGAALMAEGLLAAHDANGDGLLAASELAG